MQKKFLQDMVIDKNNKKNEFLKKEKDFSIKRINENKFKIEKQNYRKIKEEDLEEKEEVDYLNKDKNNKNYFVYFLAICCLFFLFFSISSFISRAYVEINPIIRDFILNENLTAYKDLSYKDEKLSYELIILEDEENRDIKIEEEKYTKEKAKGIVVLYNSFSTENQTLEKNTRLEGSNGKIYRTDEKVILPGMVSDIPGTKEVSITALEDGEGYNSLPIDFIVSGFKNTSKYNKIYGRSKGNIEGGFDGMLKIANEEEKEKVTKELENSLEVKLLKNAINQIPEGYILFKNAISTKFTHVIDDKSKEDNLIIKSKGTLYGFLFKEEELTKYIVSLKFKEDIEKNLYIDKIKDLDFVLLNREISFADVSNINFRLNSPIRLVNRVDEELLLSSILGKSKKDFNYILSKFDNIENARLKIKPFWQRDIPEKKKNIKIIVNYPN